MTATTSNQWVQQEPDLPTFILDEQTVEDAALAQELAALEAEELAQQQPRQYQLDGAEWLATPNLPITAPTPHFARKMLTDPPGLGKTLQAILAAQKATASTNSILVVCPAVNQKDWYEYIRKQYPSDSARATFDMVNKPAKVELISRQPTARWLVVSYDMLRISEYYNAIFSLPLETVVFDESQAIKNRNSQQSAYAESLCKKTSINNVFELTATPIMREADDLYNQLHVLDPVKFPSFTSFCETYTHTTYSRFGPTSSSLKKNITVYVDEPPPPQPPRPTPPTPPVFPTLSLDGDNDLAIRKYEQDLDIYRKLLAKAQQDIYQYQIQLQDHLTPKLPQRKRVTVPIMDPEHGLGRYMMGRTYEEVGLQLPPLVENKLVVELEPERRKMYDEMRDYWATTIKGDPDYLVNASNTMKAMHTLRMLAASNNKIKACVDLITSSPGPHLIYTYYDKSSAKLIYDLIKQAAPDLLPYTKYLSGHQSATERADIAYDDNTTILIATMQSIGQGLNLQRFRTVIFFEGDWTPGAMHQRITRVWRLRKDSDPNKHEPVLAYYILSKDTIDEKIHAKRNARTNSAREILKVELSRI